MSSRPGVPVGRGRPGRTRGDAGAVSVEAAIALIGLSIVLVAVAWVLGILAVHLAAGEAARSAARVAARGDSQAAVVAEARHVLPNADVTVRPSGDDLLVVVHVAVTGPGLLARWGAIDVVGTATSRAEQGS